MKVLFISGRETTYTRNAVILKGLRENGVGIVECASSSKTYLERYFRAVLKFLSTPRSSYDVVFVGFFGQPLVPIIRMFTKKPIILDAFLSSYDTMCFDRKCVRPDSVLGNFFYHLDRISCNLADCIILDTNAHIRYFVETFKLPSNKFFCIFVGADETLFHPKEAPSTNDRMFNVFYYGSFLPLQGIDCIVESAKLLEGHTDIIFKVVGTGPEYQKIQRLMDQYKLNNIIFQDWVPYEQLPNEIAMADICLGGHFSAINKAKRVISGKTFQFIAMKKPTIVGDNPANRELFEDKVNVMFVEHVNPEDMAATILELKNNTLLRKKIADEGYELFCSRCGSKVLGKQLARILLDHAVRR